MSPDASMPIIRSALMDAVPGMVCAVSTRHGGVSPEPFGMNLSFSVGDAEENVHRNREIFFGSIGVSEDRVASPVQIHSAIVKRADAPGRYPDCDALVTDLSDLYLTITVADCVPVILVDPVRRVLGAVHAGWRGTAAGIAGTAVKFMTDNFGSIAADILAYAGPGAGVCCYAVGREVAERFDPTFVSAGSGDTLLLDLKGAVRQQLQQTGVEPARIDVSPYCTISEPQLFHSFRRDGKQSGRMLAVAGLSRSNGGVALHY